MKIKFTDSVAGARFAYRRNQVAELPPDAALAFIRAGQAVEVVDADHVETATRAAAETTSRRPRRRGGVLGNLLP